MTDTFLAGIHVEDGKFVKITTHDVGRWIIPFRPLGRFNPKESRSIEAIDYIRQFNTAELFLLGEVDKHLDDDSKVTLRVKAYSTADQARLKRAIPLWIDKKLLKRIKRERYMVNPWFLVPPKDEQAAAVGYWSSL